MSSPKNISNSFMKLNQEEIKIKPILRKKTNYNSNCKNENMLNKIKRRKRKSKTLRLGGGIIKEITLTQQESKNKNTKISTKHSTSKTLYQKNSVYEKKNNLSNKTVSKFKQLRTQNKESKKSLEIFNTLKLINNEQSKPNLKIIENELLVKIQQMKNNFENESLKSLQQPEKEIHLNHSLKTIHNFDISNDFSSHCHSHVPTLTKKIIEKSNSLASNFQKKKWNITDDNEKDDSNIILVNSNSPKNKAKTVIMRKIDRDQLQNELNSQFLNMTDYNIQYKNDLELIKKKEEKIRNIRRIKQLYDSFDDDESEKDDDFYGRILSPNSKTIIILDLCLFLSCFYCMFYIPLRMAKSECFCQRENISYKTILYIIDFIYILDLCLSCFRGYYNPQLKLVKNNSKIFMHYLKSDLFYDFLSAIPFIGTSNFICAKYMEVSNCRKYDMPNSLIALVIMTNLKILKVFKIRNKKKNVTFNYFFNLFSENYSLEKTIDNTFDFIFCLLGFHFFVCLNIFLSNQTYPNWIIYLNLEDNQLIYIYISSCYSLIETLTTVGYGDVVCQCLAERILQIIILGVGVIAYSYIISAFGNLIKNESQSSIKYNNNMKILEEIRIDYPKMTYKLYNKIYNHIESKSVSGKKIDTTALISSLPFNLKNTLLLIMYRNIIKNFKIFKKCQNSNFIIEILSKFVPATSKKNDFLLYEGEMIEEIVFVKDGRLSLDAAIDMGDQEVSISKYFQVNFQGITSAKENKKYEENNNGNNSRMLHSTKAKDFDNAKFILNNAVKKQVNYLMNEACEEPSILDKTKLDKRKSISNINKISNNLDIFTHEPVKNEEGNYKYIKVIDIRKNENFGGLYMFLRRPSPLSLRVRSKIAELYLLSKKDIFSISKLYRNIWGKIYKKDFHNMISIKHQTFKILNKYIEMNGFGKVQPNDNSRYFALDDYSNEFSHSNKNLLFDNQKAKNLIISNVYQEKKSTKKLISVKSSKFKNSTHISSKSQNFPVFNKISQKSIENNNMINSQIIQLKSSEFNKVLEINKMNNLTTNIKNVNKIKNNPSQNTIKIIEQKKSQKKIESENNYNDLVKETESLQQEPLNNIFFKIKAKQIKEETKKSKKKEKRKKLFSLGKKTAKLFKNRNFTIIFENNTNNYYEVKSNNDKLSSKTINQYKESEGFRSFVSMVNNNIFLEGISQLQTEEEKSFSHFDKTKISPENVISFSYQSLYKNINAFSNLKYSKNAIYEEKTLSYLNKLIQKNIEDTKNNNVSVRPINSSFINNSYSNMKSMSNIIRNNSTISLSGTSSSIKRYEEFFSSKDKNISVNKSRNLSIRKSGNNNSVNKNGVKSHLFQQNNRQNNLLDIKFNRSKQQNKKSKLHKSENSFLMNINLKNENENAEGRGKSKLKLRLLKNEFQITRSLSPSKRVRRESCVYPVIKIGIESIDNKLKDKKLLVSTGINKEIAYSFQENKKKLKKKKRNTVASNNNTIKEIEKVFFGHNLAHNPQAISPRKSTREKRKSKQKDLKADINNIRKKSYNKSMNTIMNDYEIKRDNKINNLYDDNYLAKEPNDEECIII